MVYTKQENSLCYLESFYFTIHVYLPASFQYLKFMFYLKRRQRQKSIVDSNIIKSHSFHSNLNDIFGRPVIFCPLQ